MSNQINLFQSTHSLRSATPAVRSTFPTTQFQSTHSLRSATRHFPLGGCFCPCFNPRTPCGVRPPPHSRALPTTLFQSTHSLRSATHEKVTLVGRKGMFQSTHSLRSATISMNPYDNWKIVSIHALLAECDLCGGQARPISHSFNPRTPCGVRLIYPSGEVEMIKVSIHALLAECDLFCGQSRPVSHCFNPRTPCGVRRFTCGKA